MVTAWKFTARYCLTRNSPGERKLSCSDAASNGPHNSDLTNNGGSQKPLILLDVVARIAVLFPACA
jgi:hypothetical protein